MTRSSSRVKDRFCFKRRNLPTVLLAALKLNESETVAAFSAAGASKFGVAATRARPRLLRLAKQLRSRANWSAAKT